jgi:gas vesicle protein
MNNTNRTYYSREAEERAARDRRMLAFAYSLLGLAVGLVLALMFAPKSGEQTREEIERSLEHGLKDGREAVEPSVKRMEKEIADIRRKVEERVNS